MELSCSIDTSVLSEKCSCLPGSLKRELIIKQGTVYLDGNPIGEVLETREGYVKFKRISDNKYLNGQIQEMTWTQ